MEKLAAALYVADLAFLVSFQVLSRDFALLPQAISNYGLGPMARLFRVYLLAGSVAAPLLAWQFWVAREPGYPLLIPVYLLMVMLGRLTLALFVNDPPGAPRSRAGHIHHAATMLAFSFAFMTVVEATPLLAGAAPEGRLIVVTGLKYLISLAFLAVILTISPPLRRFFGLAERVFLYATALWFLTASLILPPV